MLPNRFCHRNWEKFDATRFLNETFQTYLKKGMEKSRNGKIILSE